MLRWLMLSQLAFKMFKSMEIRLWAGHQLLDGLKEPRSQVAGEECHAEVMGPDEWLTACLS